jgi:hypothetical protein
MGSMFLGGALGSAAATAAWQAGGWLGVVSLGLAFGALASAMQFFSLACARRAAATP